jgi:hypothetical protein
VFIFLDKWHGKSGVGGANEHLSIVYIKKFRKDVMPEGHYKRKRDMAGSSMESIFGSVATEQKDVRTLAKLNIGTFCRVDSIKKSADGRLYALEDAYGNIKEFTEAQVISQMQLGVLNVINLELNENNKLIRKTPEAMEVTESNIGKMRCFPLLVNVFDLTTEKEGTAVAIGYNEQGVENEDEDEEQEEVHRGSDAILNVVINGNMYEASMRPTLERSMKCKKSSCLACKERNADKCRYNRYGGGYKLCVEIGTGHKKVAYERCKYYDKLLAVAVDNNGKVKAWLAQHGCNDKIWYGFGYHDDFNKMEFNNVSRWGGFLQLDVPMIDWATFYKRKNDRCKFLESEIQKLAWRAANEGYLDINRQDYELYMEFKDKETFEYWRTIEKEYTELGGFNYCDIFDLVEFYVDKMADKNNMKLWVLEVFDGRLFYTVDPKGSLRGRHRLAFIYRDWEYEITTTSTEYTAEMIAKEFHTNIWDKDEE